MSDQTGDVVIWERFVYGKLVQRPRGPIVPGCDHKRFGRSRGFPDELEVFCHPSKLGLGDRDPSLWAKYPWSATGGMVSGLGLSQGIPWVLVARSRQRSEAGEGAGGREYTESHYAAAPLARYSFTSLRDLSRHLHAEPLTERNDQLEPIEIRATTDNSALPSDWDERIGQILQGVMSGVSVSIQDWETPPDEFLSLAAICLAAMPAGLASYLPVGAGLLTMDGTTAFATGMVAQSGLRIIGGTSRNRGDFDLSLGESYFDWLRTSARRSATLGELARVVAEELPDQISVPLTGSKPTWAIAARAVSEVVHERRKLVEVLDRFDKGGSVADRLEFVHSRQRVLEAFVDRVNGPRGSEAASMLEQITTGGWEDAWRKFVTSDSIGLGTERLALGMLFGARRIDSPELLIKVANVVLTPGVRVSVVQRVLSAVQDSSSGRAWIALFRGVPEESEWVQSWRAAASARLVWIGIHDALSTSGRAADLLECMQAYKPAVTALALVRGKVPEIEPLNELISCATKNDAPTIDMLVNRIWMNSVWLAIRVAEHADALGVPTAIGAALRGRGLRDGTSLVSLGGGSTKLAEELASKHLPASRSMVALLLWDWGILRNRRESEYIRNLLVRSLGDPYSSALFGQSPSGNAGPEADIGHEYCLSLIATEPDLPEHLISNFPRLSLAAQGPALDLLSNWIRIAKDANRIGYPLSTCLLGLAGKMSTIETPLTDKQRETLSIVLGRLGMRLESILNSANSELSLSIVAATWPVGRPISLRSDHIAALLESVLKDPDARIRWDKLITARGWSTDPGWRWISRDAREVNADEEEALGRLSGPALLELVAIGLPVPPADAARVNQADLLTYLQRTSLCLRDVALDASSLRPVEALLTFIKKASRLSLMESLASWMLSTARASGCGRDEVMRAYLRRSGWLGRLLQPAPNESPLISLLRIALHEIDSDSALQLIRRHLPEDEN